MGISADLKTVQYLEYIIRACESIELPVQNKSACSVRTIQRGSVTVSFCLGSCVGAVLQ